jgi:hypothetical protein
MSYANRSNRPDSKDTARLRTEYEKKAREARDSADPATKAKLRDEKQKLFQRVVDQMNNERTEELSEAHRVLTRMGRYKSDDQLNEEKAKAEAAKASNVNREARV